MCAIKAPSPVVANVCNQITLSLSWRMCAIKSPAALVVGYHRTGSNCFYLVGLDYIMWVQWLLLYKGGTVRRSSGSRKKNPGQ